MSNTRCLSPDPAVSKWSFRLINLKRSPLGQCLHIWVLLLNAFTVAFQEEMHCWPVIIIALQKRAFLSINNSESFCKQRQCAFCKANPGEVCDRGCSWRTCTHFPSQQTGTVCFQTTGLLPERFSAANLTAACLYSSRMRQRSL